MDSSTHATHNFSTNLLIHSVKIVCRTRTRTSDNSVRSRRPPQVWYFFCCLSAVIKPFSTTDSLFVFVITLRSTTPSRKPQSTQLWDNITGGTRECSRQHDDGQFHCVRKQRQRADRVTTQTYELLDFISACRVTTNFSPVQMSKYDRNRMFLQDVRRNVSLHPFWPAAHQ